MSRPITMPPHRSAVAFVDNAETARHYAEDFATRAVLQDRQAQQAQHYDNIAVDSFAVEMKSKLREARAKGRGGWRNKEECTEADLSRMLREHVEKGDPRDVANFCMFLAMRGERIAAAEEQQPVAFASTGALRSLEIAREVAAVPENNFAQICAVQTEQCEIALFLHPAKEGNDG